MCHWDSSFYENGHPLFCLFWKYQNRKLAMLFQCLAKLLAWNCFWRCAIEIWLQVDRSHLPIFWFLATRNMIQSLQRLRESLPLSCKSAIGILAFMRMDIIYSVSFGDTRTQAGDAVSMLGQAFGLEWLLAVCHWDLTPSWQVAPSHILIPSIAKCN